MNKIKRKILIDTTEEQIIEEIAEIEVQMNVNTRTFNNFATQIYLIIKSLNERLETIEKKLGIPIPVREGNEGATGSTETVRESVQTTDTGSNTGEATPVHEGEQPASSGGNT